MNKKHKQKTSLPLASKRSKRRLALGLLVFFCCLMGPLALLIQQVYQQFRMEMFYQYRNSAEQVIWEVNQSISEFILEEEQRSFADYQFYKVTDNPLTQIKELEQSPLSEITDAQRAYGMLGYFQINPEGRFSSPMLPENVQSLPKESISNLNRQALDERVALESKVSRVLEEASLLSSTRSAAAESKRERPEKRQQRKLKPEPKPKSPQKSRQKLKELEFDERFSLEQTPMDAEDEVASAPLGDRVAEQRVRTENIYQAPSSADFLVQKSLPSTALEAPQAQGLFEALESEAERTQVPVADTASVANVNFSELTASIGEIGPLQMQKVGEYYLFYRQVWNQNQRYLQGFVVEEGAFIAAFVTPEFLRETFREGVMLIAAYDGEVTESVDYVDRSYQRLGLSSSFQTKQEASSESLTGGNILIIRSALLEPLRSLELVLTAEEIPLGSGASWVLLLVAMVVIVCVFGLWMMYRTGAKQIDLAEQRFNFVSAVSHELKTPLTSILMYSEMLREGMVPDQAKRQSYFDFIYLESERLSRLINNVLQVSKLGRQSTELELSYCELSTLYDLIQSKFASLFQDSEFTLVMEPIEALEGVQVLVAQDEFLQVVINLVDNAFKFCADADKKEVHVGFRRDGLEADKVCFFVRDYGPGIPRAQLKKIFEMFYRVGSELTRSAPGTGIGLSLVSGLAYAMKAKIEVRNCDPGAEFQVVFEGRAR